MMGQILTNELLIKQLKIQSLVAQKQKKRIQRQVNYSRGRAQKGECRARKEHRIGSTILQTWSLATEAARLRGGAIGNDTAMLTAGPLMAPQRSPAAARTRRRRVPGLRCGRRCWAFCQLQRSFLVEPKMAWAQPGGAGGGVAGGPVSQSVREVAFVQSEVWTLLGRGREPPRRGRMRGSLVSFRPQREDWHSCLHLGCSECTFFFSWRTK